MAEPVAKKFLLIGWDAADWQLIRPLMAKGQMPHLSRLAEHGVAGELLSLEPMLSPMLWTSIATGKYPHKHGIHGFTEPRPDGRGIRAAASTSRTTKAIWNILTQRGLKAHAVGWYASHPAEPISGVCVSNYFSMTPCPGTRWEMVAGTVHPPELSEELASLRLRPEEVRRGELEAFIPGAARIDPSRDDRLAKCAVILAETATVHAAATWILERHEWDFLAVLYDGIDHFSHMFMEYQPPQQSHVTSEDFANYQHVVTTCYRFHDLMLGRLLELAGDDTTVMLVSDHGFRCGGERLTQTEKTLEGLSRWHRPEGVCVMHGPGVRPGVKLDNASLLDVTPTILQLMKLPAGEDMDGQAWSQAIETSPSRSIASWDEVHGDAGLHPGELRQSSADSMVVLRHLIELGYLAQPAADAQSAIDECVETNQFNLARSLASAGKGEEAVALLESLVRKRPGNELYGAALAEADAARFGDG